MELSSDMKVLLLYMLFKEYDEALGLAVKKQVFETTWCQGARAVQSWETVMTKKIGQVATESAAFHAMLKKLKSIGGIQKAYDTTVNKRLPLHGKSESEPGIFECRLLFQEMEKCKAGGLPPPAQLPTATPQDANP